MGAGRATSGSFRVFKSGDFPNEKRLFPISILNTVFRFLPFSVSLSISASVSVFSVHKTGVE